MNLKEYRNKSGVNKQSEHMQLMADTVELLAKHNVLREDLTYQQYVVFLYQLARVIPVSMTPLYTGDIDELTF